MTSPLPLPLVAAALVALLPLCFLALRDRTTAAMQLYAALLDDRTMRPTVSFSRLGDPSASLLGRFHSRLVAMHFRKRGRNGSLSTFTVEMTAHAATPHALVAAGWPEREGMEPLGLRLQARSDDMAWLRRWAAGGVEQELKTLMTCGGPHLELSDGRLRCQWETARGSHATVDAVRRALESLARLCDSLDASIGSTCTSGHP